MSTDRHHGEGGRARRAGAGRGHPSRGLTVVEVLVVLLATCILAAVVVPYWQQNRLRLHRADARTELVSIASRLQGCYERLKTYDDPACTAALPAVTAENTYQVIGEITASTFRLQAIPLGAQAGDEGCGAYSLDHKGQRGARGTLTPAECWGGAGAGGG